MMLKLIKKMFMCYKPEKSNSEFRISYQGIAYLCPGLAV